MLRELCELYEPVISEKNLQLTLDVPERMVIQADVHKLQRVVANLLDNAVKYTPQGGTIKLSAILTGSTVKVSVSDTGPGISPEHISSLFKRFYRADKSRSEPGSGLGLSLAQAIVHAHGGQISVHSVRDESTVFTVNLPVA